MSPSFLFPLSHILSRPHVLHFQVRLHPAVHQFFLPNFQVPHKFTAQSKRNAVSFGTIAFKHDLKFTRRNNRRSSVTSTSGILPILSGISSSVPLCSVLLARSSRFLFSSCFLAPPCISCGTGLSGRLFQNLWSHVHLVISSD